MNYSKASLLDLFALGQLEEACFPTEAFSRCLIKNLLVSAHAVVFKATEATEPTEGIVGNIIGTTKKENSLSVGRIFSLCVLAGHRKHGVATRLVQLLEEEFRLRDIWKIRLEVGVRNDIARAFYERLGYHTTSNILPHFYHDGTDAMVMRKDIS